MQLAKTYQVYDGPRQLDSLYVDAMRELGHVYSVSLNFQAALQCVYHAQKIVTGLMRNEPTSGQETTEQGTEVNKMNDLTLSHGLVLQGLAKVLTAMGNAEEGEGSVMGLN